MKMFLTKQQNVPARRSRRSRQVGEDVDMDEDDPETDSQARNPPLEVEVGEEEKPKPMLRVKYQGFDISDLCLCIVVEPWPPIRMASIAPPFLRARSQTPALNRKQYASTARSRGEHAAP